MTETIGIKLAEGGCAEVFEWGISGKKIVKLAKPNTDLISLQNEMHHTHVAWELGLPVPRVYELVEAESRNGIVFERINGDSLLERFVRAIMEQQEEPTAGEETDEFGDIHSTADLLHLVHTHTARNMDMPDQRQRIKRDIWCVPYLEDSEKTAVTALLDQLPPKHALCHGDPNPGNILLADGRLVLIDWNDATVGNPEADLAEYVVMMRYAVLPASVPESVKLVFHEFREKVIREFMAEYEKKSGITYADIVPWLVPIAARKLSADSLCEEERSLLISEIRSKLKLLNSTV
ncbi:aminoglycoside phosphotransferase family protein [Gorillibacterium massiliense]|uniref:aminoglycoside phosphotransferase family protein n=1 Tax=Gorillibacterium massiliense TaxID=1280390 RepID=UPI000594FAAF|nr:aminoglycoside phosphotransferase family protein [Gorillibacterium massiliense]